MLGHSSITITADTYTSLLPEADLAVAEAAARLADLRVEYEQTRVRVGAARSSDLPSRVKTPALVWEILAREGRRWPT